MYRSIVPLLAGTMLLGATAAQAERAAPTPQPYAPAIQRAGAEAPAFDDVLEIAHSRHHAARKGHHHGRLVASMRRHTIHRVQSRASYTSPPVSPAEDRNPMTSVERVPLGR
jgi:hypothetical protein